ncbi:MAG: PspA/IM30 family protein [Alphaproteobacteria bacterium]
MAESISKRVGRIISGSINAVVDAVEDSAPEMVMEQAMREVDNAVEDVRVELGKVVASKHLANKRLSEKNKIHEELSEKIQLAVKEERDDLAEAGIEQQLDIEAQIPVLEHTIGECGDREQELEGFIGALKAKKREMQEELRSFRKAQEESGAASAGGSTGGTNATAQNKADQATSTFDRVLEKHSGLAGVGGADTQKASQLAELEELARENRIKERLATLKKAS